MQNIPEAIAVEARAEIIWGRPPNQVLELLQAKGVGDKDALALIADLLKERAASIRADGIKKTVVGSLCIVAPIIYYFFSLWLGYWSLKFFAVLIVAGVVGLAKVTSGLSMIVRPQAVTGSLANGE
jgi:hypothetical protein